MLLDPTCPTIELVIPFSSISLAAAVASLPIAIPPPAAEAPLPIAVPFVDAVAPLPTTVELAAPEAPWPTTVVEDKVAPVSYTHLRAHET